MHCTYQIGNQAITKELLDTPLIDVQTNSKGSFFYLPLNTKGSSQYSGVHQPQPSDDGWDIFKFIYDFGKIKPVHIYKNYNAKMTTVQTDLGKITYGFENKALIVQTEGDHALLRLDCRKVYDYNEWGREFFIENKDDHVIITYTKKNQESGIEYQQFPRYLWIGTSYN